MAANKIPVFYKIFIDDGFGGWVGSVEDLESFAEHGNPINPSRFSTKRTFVKLY